MDKNIFDDMPTPPMTPNGKPIAKMGKIQEEEENHGESFYSRNGFWIKSVLIGILLAILIGSLIAKYYYDGSPLSDLVESAPIQYLVPKELSMLDGVKEKLRKFNIMK